MIQEGTNLLCADNSGAKHLKVFKILGSSKRRYAEIGDVVVASVKKAIAGGVVKKKDIVRVVIVRQRKNMRRSDGTLIRFDDNAGVIIGEDLEVRGTRIFGPIPKEIRKKGFKKIVSLAPEIL